MSTVLIFDCDVLAYRASAVIETRTIKVTHIKSGRVKTFGNRTEFKEYLSNNSIEYVKEDYEIEDIQEAGDPSVAYSIIKNQMKSIQEKTWADDSVFMISGENNFRETLPLPTRYKSNRDDTIRPIHLKKVRQYLKNAFGAEEINGCETDDAVVWTGYRLLKQGHTPIIITNDKDAGAYSDLCLYDYTKDDPQIITVPDFGYLTIEKKKVKGLGFIWYCFQLLNGDAVDCFKPSELSGKEYGQMSAYNALVNCKTHKEAIEAVIKQYKEWYPVDFTYEAWDGSTVHSNWQHMLNLYHGCCRMKSTPDDPLIAYDFFKQYDVNLDDYVDKPHSKTSKGSAMYYEIKDEDKDLWTKTEAICRQYGMITEESDGQFTAGFCSATYHVQMEPSTKPTVFTFYYENSELIGVE